MLLLGFFLLFLLFLGLCHKILIIRFLSGMHFLYRILTPHEFSLRRYAVTHLQPKPSLQKRDQKPAVVWIEDWLDFNFSSSVDLFVRVGMGVFSNFFNFSINFYLLLQGTILEFYFLHCEHK
jgi:hypothetical protein